MKIFYYPAFGAMSNYQEQLEDWGSRAISIQQYINTWATDLPLRPHIDIYIYI